MKKNLKRLKHCEFYELPGPIFIRGNEDSSCSVPKYALDIGTVRARITIKEARVLSDWLDERLGG